MFKSMGHYNSLLSKPLLWSGLVICCFLALGTIPSMYMITLGLIEGSVPGGQAQYFQVKIGIHLAGLILGSAGAFFFYWRIKKS